MKTQFRSLFALSLPFALALALGACTRGIAEDAPAPAPLSIPVALPVQQSVPIVVDLPGHVEAIERVEIRPQVSGYVERVAFTDGARVERGQILFEIDPAPYQTALAAAEAHFRQADAEARAAASEAERVAPLLERRAISTEEAERRQARAAATAASRDAARAAVKRAKLDLGHTRIVAPISGRMGRAESSAGNLVDRTHRLAVLVSDAQVYVRFDLSETNLGVGEKSAWTAQYILPEMPGVSFEGTLAFLENEINPGTGTVRGRLRLDGHPSLVPGRYGQVRLTLGERTQALLVDEKAIGADQGTRYVLVVGDGDAVQYRPVRVGARIGEMRVIEHGLEPSDRVVIAGLMAVRPGAVIAPQLVSPAPGEASLAKAPSTVQTEG